jgi:Mce-associated membrane protein
MAEKINERAAATLRRTAAVQAASRARRIGGNVHSEAPADGAAPAPDGAAPAPDTAPALDTAPAADAVPVSTPKPGPRPSPVPHSGTEVRAGDVREHAIRGVRARPWIAAIAAFVLVVGLAVADGALLQDRRNRPGTAEQRQRVVAEVNQAVATILSYDYRHLDADESAAASHLTGTFKDQYIASMNTTIKKNAPPAKAVVVGEVGTSAITSVSGDGTQAVLLVLGQQTVTNGSQKTPRYDMVNLQVTAQLVHGTWLVADLATL